MPGKIYPNEGKKLMALLSPEELEIIKYDYPFKKIRNQMYQKLMGKGVSCHVLAKLTGGLSSSSVHRIGQFGINDDKIGRLFRNINKKKLKSDLVEISAAIEALRKQINKILTHRRKYNVK